MRSRPRKRLWPTVIFGIVQLALVAAQVRFSGDLNCDFNDSCRWHNATGYPEILGWIATNDVMPDERFPVGLPDRGNSFVYTYGPPGPHMIELVSDIVACQLGGARLSFWYYYSGSRAQVDVCTRWPPGSMDPSHRHCYEPAAASARAQRWTFATVELPPMTQSFELIFRATFEAPKDVVALDDVKYEAILCENTHRVGSASGGGGEFGGDTAQSGVGDFAEDPREVGLMATTARIRQVPSSFGDSAHEIDEPADVSSIDGGSDSLLPVRPKSPFHGMDGGGLVEGGGGGGGGGEKQRAAPLVEGARRREPTAIRSNCGVDCDFDEGDFCSLASPNSSVDMTDIQPWIITRSALLNPLTGIEKDVSGRGFFVCTLQDPARLQRFVLSTRGDFSPIEPSSLQFSYYLAGVRGRLRVCTDYPTFEKCPFEESGANMADEWRQWRTGVVKLSSGKQRFHFVADQLPKNYVIGIDNVRLLDKYGRLPALCEQKRSNEPDY